jgi:hypothetical protein
MNGTLKKMVNSKKHYIETQRIMNHNGATRTVNEECIKAKRVRNKSYRCNGNGRLRIIIDDEVQSFHLEKPSINVHEALFHQQDAGRGGILETKSTITKNLKYI